MNILARFILDTKQLSRMCGPRVLCLSCLINKTGNGRLPKVLNRRRSYGGSAAAACVGAGADRGASLRR